MLKSFAAPLGGALLLCAIPSVASAAPTICTSPGCVQPDSNVLFTMSTTGNPVQGALNDSRSTMVTFRGNESLTTTASNGQARISGTDGTLNFLEILLGNGETFNSFEFNLNALTAGTATITLLGAGGSTLLSSDYAISANGQNFFGGFGDAFTAVRISSTAQLSDVRQVRLGGIMTQSAVPEPATWAMMLIGFAGVGASMRRRRGHNARLMQVA